jgi:hypothetical protein
VVGQWFSHGILVTSTNKTDCHDVTEILLKAALNIINHQYHIIWMQNIYGRDRTICQTKQSIKA